MKTVSLVVAVVGLLVALVSLLADFIGIGSNPDVFGPNQVKGALVGIVLLLIGVIMHRRQAKPAA